MGLGGAFLSLADDATAAQANPAGLGFLPKWEFFAELRSIDNSAQSSTATESLTGIDTFVATGSDLDDVVTPSFVSGVVAFSSLNRWSLGFSRQEVLNVSNATVSQFAFTFTDSPGALLAEGQGSLDTEIVNFNVSGGFRITDALGIGATLTASTIDVKADVTNLIVDTGGAFAGEPVLEPTLDLRTAIDDTDDDFVFGLGLIYKKPKWGAGLVYRQGPTFAVQQNILLTPADNQQPTAMGLDVFNVTQALGDTVTNTFGLPDNLGLGGNWNATDKLTVAANIERIIYSNMLDGFIAGVNLLTDFDAEFTVDDATEYRLGVEYVFLNRNSKAPPIALRGGGFTQSDATIRATSTGTQGFGSEEVFSGGDDQVHGTVGLGFNFKRAKLDLAADFADTNNEYVISFIYRGK
jgi:long-subunit fatty acid transport protein